MKQTAGSGGCRKVQEPLSYPSAGAASAQSDETKKGRTLVEALTDVGFFDPVDSRRRLEHENALLRRHLFGGKRTKAKQLTPPATSVSFKDDYRAFEFTERGKLRRQTTGDTRRELVKLIVAKGGKVTRKELCEGRGKDFRPENYLVNGPVARLLQRHGLAWRGKDGLYHATRERT